MKKSTKVLLGAGAAFVALLMCVSLTLNVITLGKVNAIEQNTSEPDTSMEDGVKIAGDYEVRSTLQISDAYKNGDESSLSDEDKQTLKTAKKLLGKIIKKKMTDYEKELAVYEWITKNIKHDDGMMTVIRETAGGTETPQGVLSVKKAVCVGYATTFRMLMQMMDIDCMVVHESELGHTWNLVKINGSWYHTDCYFDSPGPTYAHFNITDTMRGDAYSWDTSLYPRADSLEYCYAVRNAKKLNDVYKLPKEIKKALDKKKGIVSCSFKNISDKNKAILDRIASTVQSTVDSGSDYSTNYMEWSAVENGKDYVFFVTISLPDEDSAANVSEEAKKKINKAIEKVFGYVTDYDEEGMIE